MFCFFSSLINPSGYRTMVRQYRCNTPHPPWCFVLHRHISVRYPVLQHIARYSCDTSRTSLSENAAISKTRKRCNLKSRSQKIAAIFISESLGTFDLSVLFHRQKHCVLGAVISKRSDSRCHSAIFLRFFCGTCNESCLQLRFFWAASPRKTSTKTFSVILSLKVSRDITSIAAGPLSEQKENTHTHTHIC